MSQTGNTLWPRWVVANALAELVGLGATFAAIGLLPAQIGGSGAPGVLLSFGIAVASGALEATAVGLAQWWAMHPWFPTIHRSAWWGATCFGAWLAYALGYLPSTLMSIGEAAGQAAPSEPPIGVTLLLAAALGAVAGAVLSCAQWLVLRRSVRRAGVWVPANMLAWACGMPVIFWGMDVAFRVALLWQAVGIVGLALLGAGAIVGAIHGRFLVRLARAS